MMITIYSTKDHTAHTLRQLMDDAVTAKWRSDTAEETQTQPPRGLLLSGATIQHVHQRKEGKL